MKMCAEQWKCYQLHCLENNYSNITYSILSWSNRNAVLFKLVLHEESALLKTEALEE